MLHGAFFFGCSTLSTTRQKRICKHARLLRSAYPAGLRTPHLLRLRAGPDANVRQEFSLQEPLCVVDALVPPNLLKKNDEKTTTNKSASAATADGRTETTTTIKTIRVYSTIPYATNEKSNLCRHPSNKRSRRTAVLTLTALPRLPIKSCATTWFWITSASSNDGLRVRARKKREKKREKKGQYNKKKKVTKRASQPASPAAGSPTKTNGLIQNV